MKYLRLLLIALMLVGCVAKTYEVTIPIDGKIIKKSEATIIVYQSKPALDYEAQGKYPIYINDIEVGSVSSEIPLRVSVTSGLKKIKTTSMFSDAITEIKVEAGEVYYMRFWIGHGLILSTTHIDQTRKRESYQTITFHP